MDFNKKKGRSYPEKAPIRDPRFSWRENRQEIVTVDVVHKRILNKLTQKLWVTSKVSHAKLDRFGSFVWKQMNGNRNIVDIGVLVREESVGQIEPLCEWLTESVKVLRGNRFATFNKQKM